MIENRALHIDMPKKSFFFPYEIKHTIDPPDHNEKKSTR